MDKHIIGENAGKLWRLLSTDVHRDTKDKNALLYLMLNVYF